VRTTKLPIIKRLFRAFGIELRRYPGMGMAEYWLRRIRPDIVFDVGANKGQYGSWLRQQNFCGQIISFEPDEDSYKGLSQVAKADEHWTCHHTAIGSHAGEVEMFVTGNSSATSSLLQPMTDGYATTKARRLVEVSRLERYLEPAVTSKQRVWLKSDTQGYDLEVLRSAGELLRGVSCIQVECSVVANYEGQPLIHEIIGFCNDYGFVLSDLILGMMFEGQLIECDLIFSRFDRSRDRRLK
jgi:FkbM family methyltransferase